jgi:hypothetical protein
VILAPIFVIYLLFTKSFNFLVLSGRDGFSNGILNILLGEFNSSFIPAVLRSKTSKLLISIRRYHNLSRGVTTYILGLCLIRNSVGILSFYLFALSLGISISFINACWIRSFIHVIAMIPISLFRPGG